MKILYTDTNVQGDVIGQYYSVNIDDNGREMKFSNIDRVIKYIIGTNGTNGDMERSGGMGGNLSQI